MRFKNIQPQKNRFRIICSALYFLSLCRKYNLCLDKVDKLGDFIEIEHVSKKDDEHAKEKIMALAKTFGLTEKEVVVNTYNTLLCRKYNLK